MPFRERVVLHLAIFLSIETRIILRDPPFLGPLLLFFSSFFFLRQLNSLEKQSSRLFFRKIHDDTTLPFVARHIVSRLLSSYVLRQRYVGAAFVYPDFKPCLQFQLRWSAITFVPDPRPSYPIYPFESKKYRTPKMASVQTFLFSSLRISYLFSLSFLFSNYFYLPDICVSFFAILARDDLFFFFTQFTSQIVKQIVKLSFLILDKDSYSCEYVTSVGLENKK